MHFFVIFIIVIACLIALFLFALHFGFRAPRLIETKTPHEIGINYSEVVIPTVSNKSLFAWLMPASNAKETIIILHGWGGNCELMLPIAAPFHAKGLNVLLIDSRGHGKSDSDTFSSLPRFAEDLGNAIDWLKKAQPELTQKIAVLGHSVGAGAALLETSRRDDIDAVISVSAFAHPQWMMTRYLQSLHLPRLLIKLVLTYVEWLIGHTFASIAPLNTVCNTKVPTLIVHGKEDTTVPISDALAIIEHCKMSHIALFEVDDADHESVEKFEEHAGTLINFLDSAGFKLSQI